MAFFETFNLDILIVLITIAILLLGTYYGLFRQLKSTLKLAIPFVAVYFLVPLTIKLLNGIDFYKKYISGALLTSLKLANYTNIIQIIFYSFLFFILVYIITALIFKLFKKSKGKLPTLNKNKFLYVISRIFGFIISIGSAYIVVISLIYITSIFTGVRHDGYITKLVYHANNEYFEISELNKYQNVISSNYENIRNDIELINGQTLNDKYRFLINKKIELDKINDDIPNIFSLISEESKKIIPEANIYSLIKDQDGKMAYERIIYNEKDNQKIEEIEKYLDIVKQNKGYIELFYQENPLDLTQSKDQLIKKIMEIDSNVSSSFIDGQSKLEWKEIIKVLTFYQNYGKEIYTITKSSDEFNYSNYINTMNNILNDDNKLLEFTKSFTSKYQGSQNIFSQYFYSFYNLNNYFNLFINNQETYQKLPMTMSLPTKLILLENYDELTNTHKWEKMFTVKGFINDVLSGSGFPGHDFYTEYFLYEYLLKNIQYSKDDKLNSDDFEAMLSQIETYQKDEILQEYSAKHTAINIFKNRGYLDNLITNGYVDDTFTKAIDESEFLLLTED